MDLISDTKSVTGEQQAGCDHKTPVQDRLNTQDKTKTVAIKNSGGGGLEGRLRLESNPWHNGGGVRAA